MWVSPAIGGGQERFARADTTWLVVFGHSLGALLATDYAATVAAGALDAFDWYGTWKFLDALMSCSFAGKDCVYATGNTPQQRFMGKWSDGVPVTAAQVTDNPGSSAS